MTAEQFIDYVNEKISPYKVNVHGEATLSDLCRKYNDDILMESVDIGIKQYLMIDAEGNATKESVEIFIQKISGIAYIKSLPVVEQQIAKIKKIGKSCFGYWDPFRAEEYMKDYVNALRRQGWNEEAITEDIEKEVMPLFKKCRCWSAWYETIVNWTEQINNWSNEAQDCDEKSKEEKEKIKAELVELRLKYSEATRQLNLIGKNVGDDMNDIQFIIRHYINPAEYNKKLTELSMASMQLKTIGKKIGDNMNDIVSLHTHYYGEIDFLETLKTDLEIIKDKTRKEDHEEKIKEMELILKTLISCRKNTQEEKEAAAENNKGEGDRDGSEN